MFNVEKRGKAAMRHTTELINFFRKYILQGCARVTMLVLLLVLALGTMPAMASEQAKGVMGLMPTHDWATLISDRELAQMRGGFNGMAFNVFFSGFLEHSQGQQTAGNFTVIPRNGNAVPSNPVPTPSFGIQNGQVSVSSSIGNFGGANGIFQIAQVPGNNNIVNNNLFVKIDVFNGTGNPPIPNLASMLGNNP